MDIQRSFIKLGQMFRPQRLAKAPELARYTIRHEVIDEYVRDDLAEQSAIFRGGLERVPELDITREDGTIDRKRMLNGEDLNSDLFFALFDRDDMPTVLGADRVQPSKELSRQIMQAYLEHDDYKATHAITRGNGTSAALGFLAVQDAFMDEEVVRAMAEWLERSERMREQEEKLRDIEQQAQNLPPGPPPDPNAPPPGPPGDFPVHGDFPVPAPGGSTPQPGGSGGGGGGGAPDHRQRPQEQPQGQDPNGAGPGNGSDPAQPDPNAPPQGAGSGPDPTPSPQPPTPEQWEALKDLAKARREAREELQKLANEQETGLPQAAQNAVDEAAKNGKEAARTWGNLPGNGPGSHSDLSPDEAIKMGQDWLKHPYAREVADLIGRLAPDFRFKYSSRTVGGREVPIDVEMGNDLLSLLPSEYMPLGHERTKGRFYKSFMDRSLLQFEKVGSAETGKGPFVLMLDFSGSMGGDRHVWAKAVALSLLQIAWKERRAVTIIAFDTQILGEWTFMPSAQVDLQKAFEFACMSPSGGTRPYTAMARAKEIIEQAPAFRQADIVIATDGECGYGEHDLALQQQLVEMGVRINGISIECNVTRYLAAICTHVIPVYEMTAPSEATDMLVQAIV